MFAFVFRHRRGRRDFRKSDYDCTLVRGDGGGEKDTGGGVSLRLFRVCRGREETTNEGGRPWYHLDMTNKKSKVNTMMLLQSLNCAHYLVPANQVGSTMRCFSRVFFRWFVRLDAYGRVQDMPT